MEKTIALSRNKVIDLILLRMNRKTYEEMDDEKLLSFIKELGYGEDKDLPYYGNKIKIKN